MHSISFFESAYNKIISDSLGLMPMSLPVKKLEAVPVKANRKNQPIMRRSNRSALKLSNDIIMKQKSSKIGEFSSI